MEHISMAATWTSSRQAGPRPVRGVIGRAALHLAQQRLLAGQVKKKVCHRSARSTYSPVPGSIPNRGRPRRCSSMPRCATASSASANTGSTCRANAAWATGQNICCQRAASATVQPRSATSAPASSRSREVTRHRGGTAGTASVNVWRAQARSPHLHRRFTQHTRTASRPCRRSRGRVTTRSCSRPARDPQPGQHAASA